MPHQPQFDFYVCKVNDRPASINVDLKACSKANMFTYQQLFRVIFYLKNPRPDGFCDNAEFDIVSDIEDAVCAALEPAHALFVGRISTHGAREMYFYAAGTTALEPRAAAAMAKFPGYRYESGKKPDPQWTHYREVLYPTPHDMQRMRNRAVLASLEKEGDTLEELRRVDHSIYFADIASRTAFANAVVPLGYKIDSESRRTDKPDPRPFVIHISRIDSVQHEDINHATIELLDLATPLGGEYDGWGTSVIRPETPPPPTP